MNKTLFEGLSPKIKKDIEVRRYNLSDMISESYKAYYACEKGSHLQKLAESHIADVRSNPKDIDRLSKQLCELKEAVRLVESGKMKDQELVPKKSYDTVKPKKERVIQDIDEANEDFERAPGEKRLNDRKRPTRRPMRPSKVDNINEEESPELTDEEVEELAKHLEEIRKGKNPPTAPEKKGDEEEDIEEGCDSKEIEESAPTRKGIKCSRGKVNESSNEGERVFQLSLDFLAPSDFDIEEVVDMISNDLSQAGYEVLGHSQDTSWSKEEYGLSESKSLNEMDYGSQAMRVRDIQDIIDRLENLAEGMEATGKESVPLQPNDHRLSTPYLATTEGFLGLSDRDLEYYFDDSYDEEEYESRRVRGKRLKEGKSSTFRAKMNGGHYYAYYTKNGKYYKAMDGTYPLTPANGIEISEKEYINAEHWADSTYESRRVRGKRLKESKSYRGLENFSKNSTNKAFYKTFKKMHESLKEGKALTRQESMNLYKAANSAMTQLSVELEHNPEFLKTFNECTTLLSADVNKLLESMKNGKAPSKKTMKSLAKFSGALLNEAASVTINDSDEDIQYIDDGAGFVAPGDVVTLAMIKEYWNDNKDADFILDEYGSFEAWFEETKENYLKDLPDDIEECADRSKKVTEARDLDKVKKRIARTNEFDNGKVLHSWKQMTSEEAEELAKQKSLEDPDSTYYVAYDDIMNPGSEYKWKNGKKVNEADDPEEEVDDIPEEDTELSPEAEDFEQEYADGRQELHNKLADKFGDSEDPDVQGKLEQDRVDVAIINGEDPNPEESEDDEELDDIEPEEEVEESEDITDDELAELKKHLKEMREAKNK